MGFPRQTLPFSYVKEARAKTGSVFLCPFSYFWWVLYSSGSGFLCPFSYTLVLKRGQFLVRCLPKAACRSVTPWFKKKLIFCEVFAEGSLPERHSLVLEKRSIFCEVSAEGSPPERHSEVFKYCLSYGTENFVF